MRKFLLAFLFFINLSFTLSKGDDFAIELEELFVKRNLVRDEGTKYFYDWISPDQLIKEMGFGWNLGNSLDAYLANNKDSLDQGLQSEISWGNPYTTREMITALTKKGIKTLRLPVTWHNHLIDDRYTIDPNWMKRVKTIVDWAIENGMYVILNSHHDNAVDSKEEISYGSGYYPSIKDAEESERFLFNVWRQIAYAFNNGYDHHLIFEGLNIPRLVGTLYEYNYDRTSEACKDSGNVINEYNNLILHTIRRTGGNNAKRFLLMSPYDADFDFLYESGFKFPDDSKWNPREDRLLLSLHMFNPVSFAKTNDLDFVTFLDKYKELIFDQIEALYNTFIRNGYHVVFTEIGTVNKNNTEDRIKWADFFITAARKYHIASILWDNNNFDNSKTASEVFGLFNRKTLKWEKEGLILTYVKRSQVEFSIDPELFAITLHEYFDKKKCIIDEGTPTKLFDNSIKAEKVSEEIGLGWNLGNTLDAYSHNGRRGDNDGLKSETVWGNPYTTEEMIQALAEKGIRTIRIPVTWHNHLIDENYTIDPEWMLRVKTIVDWCLKYKLYVIINSHHDNHFSYDNRCQYGQGYYPLYRDIIESERFIFNIWRQIALAFNNGYDHHLIFEGLNEPRLAGYKYEWNYQQKDDDSNEAVTVLNEYMRLIVKAIRETGGNNEKRFIMITPYAAQYTSLMNSRFIIPDDTNYNPSNRKLILSVHMYTPYPFALGYSWKDSVFGYAGKKELYEDFRSLYYKIIVNGIQIIIGEFGSLNKKNPNDRLSWAKYYTTVSRTYHMSCILWDNNFYKDKEETSGENLGEFHRDSLTWDNEDIINAYLEGEKTPFEFNPQ